MGDHECWAQPSGLLPSEAGTVTRSLDRERWVIAEERTAKLIADIQPNRLSEERRSAVADYVQRLIQKCLDCEVFTFGSVPLKTYLPDGDIDLSAFSKHQNLKDTWANEVRDVLENEEKSENAEFRVKEVQYIQAEVKLIKCLVENIVVDISFNQLGGLCTLCFLDEVDKFIGHNHLFKRSIILVKAWCYYESRILGAHHGLISTYALETLVLYIFHVFNNSFSGPLEVLYRFLAFFSNFDWESYCVSLRGPIPLQSLPNMTAEPPRKDGGKLLFDKPYLDKCSTVYAVSPGGQTFISKYFNVVDPLRTTNNLGRSVSKGNFYRIRSAFGFGAKKLAKILECPRDKIVYEIDQFFMNTGERHGSGQRPDAPTLDIRQPYQQSSPNNLNHVEANSSTCSWKDSEDNSGNSITHGQKSSLLSHTHDDAGKSVQGSRGISTGLLGNPSERRNMRGSMNQEPLSGRVGGVSSTYTSRSNNKSAGNRSHHYQASAVVSEQSLNESGSSTRNQKGSKTDLSCADLEENVVSHFVRAFSSPELTNVTNENILRGRKFRGEGGEAAKTQVSSSSSRTSQNSTEKRRRNMGSDSTASHASKNAVSNDSFVSKQDTSHDNIDTDKGRSFSNYSSAVTSVTENHDGRHGLRRETEQTEDMSETTLSTAQDEQDQANNFMGMGQPHYLNRQNPQIHFPVNVSNLQLPVPVAPSLIAPMYAPTNLPGMVRTSVPLVESGWGLPGQSASYTAMRFPQGAIPPMPPCIPSIGLAGHSRSEDANASEKVEASQQQEDGESHYESNSWHQIDEPDALPGLSVGSDIKVTRSYHAVHDEAESSNNDNFSSSSSGFNSFVKAQKKFLKDGRGQFAEERISSASQFSSGRFDDTGIESSSKGVSSSVASGSSKAVENNWTGATGRVPKSSRDKRGKGRGNGSNDFSSLKSRETGNPSHMKTNSGWQPGSNFITGDEMVNQDAHSSGTFSLESTTHDDHQASFEHASKSSESSSVASYTQSKNMGPVSTAAPRIQPSNLPAYEPGAVMPSDSAGNMSPVPMGQGLKQRSMDNPGVHFAFYPTGPPVPFYMFPLSYIPPDGNPRGDLSNSFDNMSSPDDNIDGRIDHCDQGMDNSGYDMGECSENSQTYGGLNMGTEASIMDHGDEMNPDILSSDFNSHWLNLQYGRFCQNPCSSTPLFCPPSAAIPPMYLQGHIPWEGPGRPLSTNMGMLTQFVSYGHRFVPVIPLQPNSNRPTHNFHRLNGPNRLYARGGTGTYLPIPKQGSYKDRQSSGNKNNRNSYNHDRSDHGDRDAGWPLYPKGKGAGRGQNRYDHRNQTERSNSRVDRLSEMKGGERYWDLYRNDNIRRNSFQAYHGPYSSANPPVSAGNVGAHGASGMSYGMYPLQTMNAFGNVPPMPGNGPSVPSVVMLYPYDHNMGFTPEPLEFGSLGPVQIPGSQEGRLTDGSSDAGPRFNEDHFYENHKPGSYSANTSPGGSPTDQPSSPQHHQRSSTQRSYQLKDEDFPPLSFRNQSGRGRSNSFNMGNHSSNSGSHYQSFLVSPS